MARFELYPDFPSHLSVPDGFVPTNSRGHFTAHNGPIFMAETAGDLRSGFFVLDRHCNGLGFLHGGMMSAFADRSLAVAVWSASRRMSVTLKLTLHYYETVRLGDWVEAHPSVQSVGDGVVQVSADMKVNGAKVAARADATFKLLRRPQKEG